jgi:hypothetical protein
MQGTHRGLVMQTLNYQFKQLYYRNRDGIYAIYAI